MSKMHAQAGGKSGGGILVCCCQVGWAASGGGRGKGPIKSFVEGTRKR